jgi:hypothetical protein
MARVSLPSAQDAPLDDGGRFTTAYRRFLEGLWSRTGKGADLTITPTSDTVLTFSYRGSDGVLRSGTITLS